MTPDPYLAFVGFYNDWSAHVAGDKEFYERLAARARGPIVELGAGTGRVCIPIAEAGIDVIAVDASPAMLDEARRRAETAGVSERMSFVEADMRTWVASPPVELVIIPFRSFLHLVTTDDQLAALRCIAESLTSGGLLALNMFVPDPTFIAANDGKRQTLDTFTDESGRRCEISSVPVYEAASQRISLRAICDVYRDDRLVETTETVLDLRMVYRYEMEHLLARAGFEIEAVYGGFDEEPLTETSREMIWVARKP